MLLLKIGSTEFYNKHVWVPETEEDLENISAEHEIAGFTGACASADAVNIVFDKLP